MKQRYIIIERYDGLFNSIRQLGTTDDLHKAVCLVKLLNAGNENPCYDYDFRKIATDVDAVLDWFPSISLFGDGKIIDCKNYKEFLEMKPTD